jgi:hypothetical protein
MAVNDVGLSVLDHALQGAVDDLLNEVIGLGNCRVNHIAASAEKCAALARRVRDLHYAIMEASDR